MSLRLPGNIDRETVECLADIQEQTQAQSDFRKSLNQLAAMYNGGPDVWDNEFFPTPDANTAVEWQQIKRRLGLLVNLTRASVRRIRTAVYGGGVERRIIRNPYKDLIIRFIGGRYPADMRNWFTSRVLYGFAAAVPILHRNSRGAYLDLWLPNPLMTYLVPDYEHVRDYRCVAAWRGKRLHFVTRTACGVLIDSQDTVLIGRNETPPANAGFVQQTDFGFLPCVVAHGDDRRYMGEAYSASLVPESVRATQCASDVMLNARMLQKLQTKGIIGIRGLVEQQNYDIAQMMKIGVLFLDKDGGLQWAIPQSGIGDTLSLFDKIIDVSSIVMGIPVHDFNPRSGDVSAEEARRRIAQLSSLADEQSEAAELDEEELILRGTALERWSETRSAVDLEEFAGDVETEVIMHQSVYPGNELEQSQVTDTALRLGIKLAEDIAREWNPRATVEKIARVTEQIEAKNNLRSLLTKQEAMTMMVGEPANAGVGQYQNNNIAEEDDERGNADTTAGE